MTSASPWIQAQSGFIRFRLTHQMSPEELRSVFREAGNCCSEKATVGALCIVETSMPDRAAALYAGLRELAQRCRGKALRFAFVGSSSAVASECDYGAVLAAAHGIEAQVFLDEHKAKQWVLRAGS
jgi:hypothetical protein